MSWKDRELHRKVNVLVTVTRAYLDMNGGSQNATAAEATRAVTKASRFLNDHVHRYAREDSSFQEIATMERHALLMLLSNTRVEDVALAAE